MWWRSPWLRRRALLIGLAGFDLLALVLAYNTAYHGRFSAWPGLSNAVLGLIGLWLGASYLLGRYSRPQRRHGLARALLSSALVALLVLAVVAGGLGWGLDVDDPRTLRSFALPMVAASALLSALAQAWAHSVLTRPQHWILIGSGAELAVVAAEIARDGLGPQLQLTLLNSAEAPGCDLPALASASSGIAVSEQAELDEEMLQRLLALRGGGTRLVSLLNWAEQVLQRVPPELFSSRWLVQAEGFELQPERFGWRLKRLGDLLVAGLLLLLTLPVLSLAALLVRLEDGGPVLYGQVRSGLYGEPIRIQKLRSMRVDAEAQGIRWASAGDARVTRVGRWLRRLRIDELPQLLSVLRGEMSLIGPRPERPELEEQLEQAIPHYRVRHWIRPGLSGWAQVCHPYGASVADSRRKLSYDLYYLRNASLPLDLLILFKTLRLVLAGQGAEPEPAAQRLPARSA
ncbi:MAG: exopolysaccharide biosynthesis polyprenyl glycosylphosphotransferase [Vulcanococcus sp.]